MRKAMVIGIAVGMLVLGAVGCQSDEPTAAEIRAAQEDERAALRATIEAAVAESAVREFKIDADIDADGLPELERLDRDTLAIMSGVQSGTGPVRWRNALTQFRKVDVSARDDLRCPRSSVNHPYILSGDGYYVLGEPGEAVILFHPSNSSTDDCMIGVIGTQTLQMQW